MLKFPDTIKMVITDFDGIVTDNCVYISSDGVMSRKLNFKDVMAFSILKRNGYKIGIISGEENSAIELIAKKFQVEEVHQGVRDKLKVLNLIIKKYSLSDEEFIYAGDDINDCNPLCRAKYAVTVPGAAEKVIKIPGIQITRTKSGEGAFREIADSLISSSN